MRTIHCLLLPVLAAPALCQTPPCHAEFGGPNYTTGSTMGGPMIAVKLTPPNTLVITRMELFTGGRTGASTIYAYAHDAANNQPFGLTPLGSGSFTEVTAYTWQGANITPPVVLPANTTFWFGWKPVGGEMVPREGMGATLPGVQQYRGSNDNGQTWTGPFVSYQWKLRLLCAGQVIGAITPFGTGCKGSNQLVQTLGSSGTPTINQPYTISLASAAGVRPVTLGLGFSSTSWAGLVLPYNLVTLNAPGCMIYTDFTVSFPSASNAAGDASQLVVVPNDGALLNMIVYHQWAIIDAGANALGLATSGAAKVQIGN